MASRPRRNKMESWFSWDEDSVQKHGQLARWFAKIGVWIILQVRMRHAGDGENKGARLRTLAAARVVLGWATCAMASVRR